MGIEILIPRKRRQPFKIITSPDGMPVLLFDFGTLDGHQEEDIIAKIQEGKPKRLLVPKHVAITRLRDKLSKQITGYVVEQKEV